MIPEQVRKRFQQLPEDGVIASKALHTLSTESQQVDKVASRLCKTEGLKKLRNGLFFKPYISKHFGTLPPKEKDIIRSVKQQYNAKILPSGDLAAYELGLTHRLPDAITYETDKRIAPINIDSRTIRFRKVDPKKLSSVNHKLFGLLRALEFLYKTEGELKVLQRQGVLRLLNRYPTDQINKALIHWPRWFQEKIQTLTRMTEQRYITGLSAFNIPYQDKQADWHQAGMLHNNKFQIAGDNYDSAPNLMPHELFDCGSFLKKHNVELNTSLCAKPLRAIKDILYNNIIKKQRYPGFLMLNQFMLDELPGNAITGAVNELRKFANPKQQILLDRWLEENERNQTTR